MAITSELFEFSNEFFGEDSDNADFVVEGSDKNNEVEVYVPSIKEASMSAVNVLRNFLKTEGEAS